MHRPVRTRAALLGLAGLVAWAVVGVAVADRLVDGVFDAAPATAAGGTGAGTTTSFGIRGDVDGLAPGREAVLRLELDNPHDTALQVEGVTVTVGDAADGCPADVLEVAALPAPVAVAARGTASAQLVVRMRPEAGDACQGGSFPLSYAGTGRLG